MTHNSDKGIVDTPSHHSVDETVEKLKGILQSKGNYPIREIDCNTRLLRPPLGVELYAKAGRTISASP